MSSKEKLIKAHVSALVLT